jgi:hypothetical protein
MMNQAAEPTHVAVPKDVMSAIWAYLEQRPFKEVGGFLTGQGFRMVTLDAQPLQLAPISEETQEPQV